MCTRGAGESHHQADSHRMRAFTVVLFAIFWLSERTHHGHGAAHLER
jgi:hypothetical protein